MRVDRCAECRAEIAYGEMMFPVYWSVPNPDNPTKTYFVCKKCMQSFVQEKLIPGGRI